LQFRGTARAGPLRETVAYNKLFSIYKGQWKPLLPLTVALGVRMRSTQIGVEMKKFLGLVLILLLAAGSLPVEGNDQNDYRNEEIGIAFNYPEGFVIDDTNSRMDPLSVVFAYGDPPFSVHVLFKEVTHANTLEAFITQERKEQEIGGYSHEVEENSHQIREDVSAIEFIRASAIGTIYYFVFPSPKAKKLFAFYHVTSKVADPDEIAVDGYKLMRDSLEVLD